MWSWLRNFCSCQIYTGLRSSEFCHEEEEERGQGLGFAPFPPTPSLLAPGFSGLCVLQPVGLTPLWAGCSGYRLSLAEQSGQRTQTQGRLRGPSSGPRQHRFPSYLCLPLCHVLFSTTKSTTNVAVIHVQTASANQLWAPWNRALFHYLLCIWCRVQDRSYENNGKCVIRIGKKYCYIFSCYYCHIIVSENR